MSTEIERLDTEPVLPARSMTLFRTEEPAEILVRATAVADALAGAVRKQGLALNIQGKEYVKVEGWTLLGTLLGVYPVVVGAEPVPGTERECTRYDWQGGKKVPVKFTGRDWSARVEARDKGGSVVGAAVSVCSRSEKRWQDADDYAVNSMAQTRATSKALRLPLGFIMSLAGFEATPADEVPDGGFKQHGARPAPANHGAGPHDKDVRSGEGAGDGTPEGPATTHRPEEPLTSEETDRLVEKLADLFGLSKADGPVATCIAAEDEIQKRGGPIDYGSLDRLTRAQAKALYAWAESQAPR